MKRFYIALCAFAITLFITGASVWEGSATVSTTGELPDGAYYVATNSFPRNTVVDVTNLENGRTIRVIVAAGLDSPGLLAMLSRNAAIAIGIQTRAVGRIRMTQPSDPVAYSRFTEGQEAGAPNTPAVVSAPTRAATASDLVSTDSADNFYVNVINKPEPYNPPPIAYPNDGSVLTEPVPNWAPDGSEPRPIIAEVPSPAAPPAPRSEPPVMAVPIPEPSSPQQTLVPVPQPISPPSVITLVPADPRPPEGAWALPPASEIAPAQITPQPSARSARSGDDNPLDPRYFIGPIYPLPTPSPTSRAPVNQTPVVQAVPEKPPLPNGSIFSVPIINQMQRDKYYIQVGAFTQPDALQYAVSRIDRRNYPLLVQPYGALDNLVYRLLVGPLNYGESGAVLQRLKSSGYPDAFVRN
ncbi:hypothetical protein TREPR_2353 [Treponema primitia ZAS-2]|uniref:SPOR domain-containing protein n=1 Tax=Treponema primitia (strain ATCC BAA-887 / DSM 12427 / ZAS-2) TaxID=545694 RepID=F5YHV3_TREPZ|nr:SPOR domain-containing protein [Treponema primitia]AEF85102.1 hypothetical protein TREPR_2353 [Treponema primitia ZAS-2]